MNLVQKSAPSSVHAWGMSPSRGFTLIEIIAVLVLLGITGAMSGLMLSHTVRLNQTLKEAALRQQQVDAALLRLSREWRWAAPDSLEFNPDAATLLRWNSTHPERTGAGQQTLSWDPADGGSVLLNGTPLLRPWSAADVSVVSPGGGPGVTLTLGNLTTIHRTR